MSESGTDADPHASEVTLTVNGTEYTRAVPTRTLLVHFLRWELGLTGTKIGCETSACGCCTVLLDGDPVKSCTLLAAQVDGRKVTTIEDLDDEGELDALQQSFSRHHAQQCGYCTPGMVMAATGILRDYPNPSREEIKGRLSGNLCRCTGYRSIVDAVQEAARSDD